MTKNKVNLPMFVYNDSHLSLKHKYHFNSFMILWSAVFFKTNFSKQSFRNTIRVSNSLDPDQA